jgi:hypothetical protein
MMRRRDPATGLTDKELEAVAEQLYNDRDDPDAWEPEPAPQIAPDVRSVVSVRFGRGELGQIESAAAAAGVPLSTYIRNAALNAASPVDVDGARRQVEAIHQELERLRSTLAAPLPDSSKRRPGARRNADAA